MIQSNTADSAPVGKNKRQRRCKYHLFKYLHGMAGANSVDLDQTAHNEQSDQDLHCLPESLSPETTIQEELQKFLTFFADQMIETFALQKFLTFF